MGVRRTDGWPAVGGLPMMEGLPGWLTLGLALGTLGLSLLASRGSPGGRDAVGGGEGAVVAAAGLRYLGLLLNFALVGVGAHALWARGCCWWERWTEANGFIDRVWQIVTEGAGSAGTAGKDLGDPDDEGVYTRQTRTGGNLFLRLMKDTEGNESWEWSLDKEIWTPALQADSFWNGKSGVSPTVDKILIRRLQVECALRAQQPAIPASTHPPPIDLELPYRQRLRLMKEVPKEFLCPMSLEVMTEPVVTPSGYTYNRATVEKWISEHHCDPATKAAPLLYDHLYPNLALRDMIQRWLVDHKYVRT